MKKESISLQQLRYFVVSADVGSFSKAAAVLYTNQSNISRTIGALEEELGCRLFLRQAHGIHLSESGKRLYEYAARVLNDMDELAGAADAAGTNRLSIAAAPGSWFARTFVKFYLLHQKEGWHFLVHTGNNEDILHRVESGRAELGFLYLFIDKEEEFRYRMQKSSLVFTPLKEVHGMLYTSENTHSRSLPFVQMEQDEFASQNTWHTVSGLEIQKKEPAVLTNSDYIMRMLLDQADTANISAESFCGQKGTLLDNGSGNAVYGYVHEKDTEPGRMAQAFIQMITSELSDIPSGQ